MTKPTFWPRIYIAATVLAGSLLVALTSSPWNSNQNVRVLVYVCAAFLASRLRVTLPGITGTMSVNYIFTLLGVLDLNLSATLLVTWAGILGQVIPRLRSFSALKIIFNLASIALAAASAFTVYHASGVRHLNDSLPFLLLLSSAALFLVNTFSVSGIIGLTEKKNILSVWRESFGWTAAHHLVGAALVAVLHCEEKFFGWESVLLTCPVIYLLYRSYTTHLSQLESAKAHSLELAGLHWRTIEALALAIDAKDETTHSHLLRVKVYATEVGKELQLSEEEMQALQAASFLHDIGKLAVPEYIISKPGKLTPEEFEKMKVHPTVGAEILDRVRFPYPVVPIVRCHHEKWNGKGYPNGLAGEDIPIGARILAAVDCLDALASDRQYRKALPLEKAMEIVVSESGTSFDPKIVEILQRRYVELEHMATSIPHEDEPKLSKNAKFELGEAPAAGFESSDGQAAAPIDFMVSIAAARQEFQTLIKLTSDIDGLLRVEDIGSLLATRVRRMVPHETIALYIVKNEILVPAYVSGEDSSYFSDLTIPFGQGLSGWVAENHLPIVNGNPSVEDASALNTRKTKLRSALSVPLESRGRIIGALTLYSSQADYYTRETLRILQTICAKASATIASAIEHERVAMSAVTDELTGLPNARSLFNFFEEELKRAAPDKSPFAVLLIDINGFKRINDTLGHLTGNRILERVSKILSGECRENDYIGRLGGDEFVIIIPGASKPAVAQTVQSLSCAALRIEESSTALSFSVGTAFYPEDGESAEELLEYADQRMYQCKRDHYKAESAAPNPARVMILEAASEAGKESFDPASYQFSALVQ